MSSKQTGKQNTSQSSPAIEEFIERWEKSSASERANYVQFLTELCTLLGVAPPIPTVQDDTQNAYVFERAVTFQNNDGTTSTGRIDLYKRGSFVLEAKQGSGPPPTKTADGHELLLKTPRHRRGTAIRGTKGWDEAMVAARGQAEQYVRALPAAEGNPPFLVVVDVGHSIELYSDFSRLGKTYVQYLLPADPAAPLKSRSHRFFLSDLRRPEIRAALVKLWTDPLALDPSRQSAKVTRDIAITLGKLAKRLEAKKHDPELVAQFLMRCLFTLFAEDVKLIKDDAFTKMLEGLKGQAKNFKHTVPHIWREMDTGADFNPILKQKLLKFNGGLFAESHAIDLSEEELDILIEAAKADWADVEPAIFGTLLERALDPTERHKLGAHYTPRAYVERLVLPTVIEPLREDWKAAQTAAIPRYKAGQKKRAEIDKHASELSIKDRRALEREADALEAEAFTVLHDFLHTLCTTKVLDPACGSGNFLYVTLAHMKGIELEVRELLRQLGDPQLPLEVPGQTVHPEQFYGLEINPRAAVIADLVLWIGYLQWHFQTHAGAEPAEPVLRDLHNIKEQDAVLAYDEKKLLLDDTGKPVTRWDGKTLKKHSVTDEEVPDDSARAPVYQYIKPRKADWPKADFIVGNPPFIGDKRMRDSLGGGYVDGLRAAYAELGESIDFVLYWWSKSAEAITKDQTRRFGLITTNSITQPFNRRLLDRYVGVGKTCQLAFAIPDHPWADSDSAAAVRIGMSVVRGCDGTLVPGVLAEVIDETEVEEDAPAVALRSHIGRINSDFTIGADQSELQPLRANEGLACPGVQLSGMGFVVEKDQLRIFQASTRKRLIRPYINGKDIAQHRTERYVIDTLGVTRERLQEDFPDAYQWLLDKVKPERDQNTREKYRKDWWIFAEPRTKFRPAINSLTRYIATCRTARHRVFVFESSETVPDAKVVAIGSDSAFIFGSLSSRTHVVFATHVGGWLGVGNDATYNHADCFNKFPFPDATESQKEKIRQLGESLDAHRKAQQKAHLDLTLTDMYNVLEKLREREALTTKEKKTHEAGLVSVLKQIHDELDAAVFAAYGWPADLTDEQILERLVALNHERAEEEKQGNIRYLRPDFQNPSAAKPKSIQGELGLKPEKPKKGKAKPAATKTGGKIEKIPWPKSLPDQAKAVKTALTALAKPTTPADLAKSFKSANKADLEELLDTLVSLGQAREVEEGRYLG